MSRNPQRPAAAPLRLHRRRLIQGGVAAAGGLTATAFASGSGSAASSLRESWAAWLAQNSENTPASIDDYVPVALSDTELATLRATVGRIFPTDESGPGAIEAGAFIYIDRRLAGADAYALPTYQAGLAALSAASEEDFATLSESDQDALLTRLEAADVADAPDGFFTQLLTHTRQGMFSDPIHGGNREFIGWDMIGYAGVKLVWSEEEQALDAIVKPEHISVEQYGGQAQ